MRMGCNDIEIWRQILPVWLLGNPATCAGPQAGSGVVAMPEGLDKHDDEYLTLSHRDGGGVGCGWLSDHLVAVGSL